MREFVTSRGQENFFPYSSSFSSPSSPFARVLLSPTFDHTIKEQAAVNCAFIHLGRSRKENELSV